MDDSSRGIPFKVKVNKNPCVIVIGSGSVSIEFTNLQKSLDIEYEDIRCIQHWKDKVLLNAQVDCKPYLFLIEQKKAERIHRMIVANLEK